MIQVICALNQEAKPLQSFYSNDPLVNICVLGSGKNQIPSVLKNNPGVFYVNIGICGCKDEQYPIGQSFYINAIQQHATKEWSYPDIPFAHPFQEASITCFEKPINHCRFDGLLADMESYYIFSEAKKQVFLDQIQFIKIISDHMLNTHPKTKDVFSLIECNLESISKHIHVLKQHLPPSEPDFEGICNELCQKYRFTQTMSHECKKALKYYYYKHQTLPKMTHLTASPAPSNKYERSKVFDELLQTLRSSIC